MPVLGATTLRKRLVTPSPGAAFPHIPANYTSHGGAIIVPPDALDRWWAYQSTLGATRRSLVVIGDSTTYGAGGNYSWLQRLRDRAVSLGMADGGKGIFAGLESALTYDAPEVNGFVSTTFAGSSDSFDNMAGAYFFDAGTIGHSLVLQFRSTAARLWYSQRSPAGDFTYSVDGGGPVTVSPQVAGVPVSKFVFVSGLAPDVTHTITITVATAGPVWIALAPVNASGLSIQKHAVTGASFTTFFQATATPPYTSLQEGLRYQTAMGLTSTPVLGSNGYVGATVDTSYAEGARVAPVLAIADLGFNDLTSLAGPTDLPAWAEYVKRFGAACRAASCDGIVISGQLPYNANWPTYGPARFAALRDTAIAQGLAFVDHFYPIGGPALSYAGGTQNPHLTKAQYVTQADFVWDNLLGFAA